MSNAPKWLSPVAVVGLLWNLLGCYAWYTDLTLTPEALAALSPQLQQMHASMPVWAPTATGVAVLGGAVGCIGLLMRKRWATRLLWLSLAGVVVQDIGLFVIAGGASLANATAFALQGVVLAVSILLVLLARRAERAGWLGV
jgi:hypothetical protein